MSVIACLFAVALAACSRDTKTFLIGLAVAGVLIFVACLWDTKRRKRLIGEGKMIERDSGLRKTLRTSPLSPNLTP